MEKKPVPIINQDFDLQLFVYIIRKNIRWILVLFGVASLFSFLYLRYTIPEFESSAIIQLTDDNESLDLLNSKDKFNDNGIAQEIELLRSPVFLQRTLDSLPLEVTYFNKGRILDFDSYSNGPYSVAISNAQFPAYNVPVQIVFTSLTNYSLRYVVDEQKYEYDFITNKPEQTAHFEIITSVRDEKELMKPANEYFFKINNPGKLVEMYAKNLSIVVLNEAARTIRITNRDVNYNRASDVVNGVAREFKYFNLEKKRESVDLMIEYIDKTLGIVKYRLTEADSSLTAFKKEHRITEDLLNLNPLENSNIELLRQYENNKFETEIQLLVLNDVIKNVNKPEINIYEILTSNIADKAGRTCIQPGK